MTRINTNIAALQAHQNLSKSHRSLNTTLERLSTGFKINRASDAPAGLVISEKLRSQISSLHQAVDNTERAINLLNTAEGALDEVNSILVKMQDLVLEAANDGALSQEEILANQAEIDSAVQTINRIASTTQFGGIQLLNGARDYVTSGVPNGNVRDLQIHGAAITNNTSRISVTVTVTGNASQAILSNSANGIGNSGASLLISGNKGAQVVNLAASAANSAILAAVNSVSDITGVAATLSGGSLFYRSSDYGSDQFVSIRDIANLSSTTQYMDARDTGADLVADINGTKAASRGLTISVETPQLNASFTLSSNFYSVLGGGTSAVSNFYITGGGFAFNVGPDTEDNNKAFFGIQRATADNLGDRSVGFLTDIVTGGHSDLLTRPENAQQIIDEAIDDVTTLRARMGAQNANIFQTNINSLNVYMTNLTASESKIRDADFAEETTEFTRQQILVQAGTAVLQQANLSPQSVLQLLA